MRTLVVSDLHLGARTGVDLLRRAPVRARLLERLDGVDRLVLLGDTIELRHGPPREALAAAEPALRAIGAAMRGGVVVLDTDLRVEVWNEKAYELWGVRDDEVRGMHFMMLDIGLPVQTLAKPIRACLLGESESESLSVEAVNRRGKSITCEITCMPMRRSNGDEVRGVIVLMEETGQRGAAQPS